MAGQLEEAEHCDGPAFLLDFDQGLQFPEMMSIAQGMRDAGQAEIGLPVVMDEDADQSADDVAAAGATA